MHEKRGEAGRGRVGGRKVGRMADQNGSGGKRISLSGATRKFSNTNLELGFVAFVAG